MLNFCDFIQVYVFTTNHHLNIHNRRKKVLNIGGWAGGGGGVKNTRGWGANFSLAVN